jgi:hypothetical protein
MRRKRMRFGNFMVTLFTCNAGEERIIPTGELNRGLSEAPIDDLLEINENAKPLNPITLFTKGSFVFLGGDEVYPIKAGEGATRSVYAERLDNIRLRAVEEGSEYHCILPLDRTARYWDRRPVSCEAGQTIELSTGQFLYIATGAIEIGGKTFTGPAMVESSKDQTATAIERVHGVKIWI